MYINETGSCTQMKLQKESIQSSKAASNTFTDMTLEEYKKYINDRISKIPFHPSHSKITEYLSISDEGYQAMMEDVEYEKWVLGYIQENRSVNMSLMTGNPNYKSGTDYVFIGATKEECRGAGFNEWKSDTHADKHIEKEKAERKRRLKAQYQKDLLKKQELKESYEHAAKRKAYYSEYLEKTAMKDESEGSKFPKKFAPLRKPAKMAASSYENNIMLDQNYIL